MSDFKFLLKIGIIPFLLLIFLHSTGKTASNIKNPQKEKNIQTTTQVNKKDRQLLRTSFYKDTGIPVPTGRSIRLDRLYAEEEINEENAQKRSFFRKLYNTTSSINK